MAITVTKMADGPRNAVYHVSIVGDGSGELTDQVIIDPAEFDPAFPALPTLSVRQLWYDLSGFLVRMEYDYLASDTPVWTMSENGAACMDFTFMGGIADRSASDGNGKLKITTVGLGTGDYGTFIVAATKY